MVAEHRSIIPTIPGVPSWGAVLIAITFAAVGFAFDAGSGGKELTAVFAGAYVVGCIAAVLAVRQSGVFTAVIQPPLILFVTVPGAYFLFHGATIDGVKDLLINCGYPLIERFPLMFFTSAVVLLIGMVRWYQGMSSRRAAPAEAVRVGRPVRGGDVQDLGASGAGLRGRGRCRGARAASQQAAFDRPGQPGRRQDGCRDGPNPQRTAGQARPTVAVAARPPAGDRDHRARGRASAPTPDRPPGDRADDSTGRAASSVTCGVGARTSQATAAE